MCLSSTPGGEIVIMKILKVSDLNMYVNSLSESLQNQQRQFKQIEISINEFIQLQGVIEGGTGESIRMFYKDYHIPFLRSMDSLLSQYQQVLKDLQADLFNLEPDEAGYINQEFLENDLHNGLETVEKNTIDLVDQVNDKSKEIQDIVSLPELDDSQFLSSVQTAKKRIQTTIDELHAFDYRQVNRLESIETELEHLQTLINQIDSKFTNKQIQLDRYHLGSIQNPTYGSGLHHALSYYGRSEEYFGLEDDSLFSIFGSTPMRRSILFQNNNQFTSIEQNENSNSKVSDNNFPSYLDFEYKENIDLYGQLGSPGIGNYGGKLEVNIDHLDVEAGASLVDSNKMLKEKGLDEEKYYQKLFYGNLQGKIGLAEFDDDFISGDLIGGKAELAVSHSRLAHEVSPARLDFKLLQADANAGIENYSIGIGAKVSATHSELIINPLNWFGYEPLEEWFGIEWDPYIGVEASLGSIGASVKAGMENELYAAYGIGIGIKFGAEKNEE